MLWWKKLKKRFLPQRSGSSKALRRRKLEKYMPIIVFFLGLLALMVLAIVFLVVKVGVPLYDLLTEPNAARDWILSYGKWSYLFFMSIIFLQVVVAILPGEPFQIAAGLAFGPVVASILSVVGTLVASITTFMLTRIFGYKIIDFLFSERTRSKMDLSVYDRDSIERVVIIAFLIPGSPKDFMAYAVGLTPLPLRRWIMIAFMTRTAPIIFACLSGNAINNGDMQTATMLVIVGAVINIGVYIVYEIVHRYNKRRKAR